jgi:superfamily I DNA/RNA helicase/mRNA-degrading endonuclease RelE of RelBE toxin-antitoxin system
MNFRIADTFTDSLARLTGDEQKHVKTTAFDLQMNPANPGMSFHKLDRARDKNFWSVRVSRDIRMIVHRTESSLLLCYVDHHDKAYQWAERRKLETHPKTGAAQLVEIRETIQEILIPTPVPKQSEPANQPELFRTVSDDELLAYGVPPEWLSDVRNADEDSLLALTDHLPSEASEALLEIATGGHPPIPTISTESDPFEHPDAQRRFRVVSDSDELARALDYPWDKWSVFLHPVQRQIAEKDYSGAARVSGSAGTGKTIVALHRAVVVAKRNPDARVLLTTFSEALANALHEKLKILIQNEPSLAERIDVESLDSVGERLYRTHVGSFKLVSQSQIKALISENMSSLQNSRFSIRFLIGEWEDVVDAWQLKSWEEYRDVKRLGRKTRLQESQRQEIWQVFNATIQHLESEGLITKAGLFLTLADQLRQRNHPPYDFIIVDEAQDISVSQLRFLSAMAHNQPNALFFAGDLGQRIFQTPFSWLSLGVDIRGRSSTLRVNYRTSHQIRQQADRLLGPVVSDVDGNVEERRGTVSVFNGPNPDVHVLGSEDEEIEVVAEWLKSLAAEGFSAHELVIFVRSEQQLPRAIAAADLSGIPFQALDERMRTITGKMTVSSMHLAKGLEFRAVAVMAVDDEVIPLQERIESVADHADLEEVYDTERHLLYVACTRARDRLIVTSVDPASEFLEDMLIN